MNTIQINNVTKRYRDITALDHVSFSLSFGKIYGLLGRNGAGKSTLINILSNRIFADEGSILINGQNAKENMEVQELIFCMSEADLYDKELKVKDLFKWINRFYESFDLKQALSMAKQFSLDPKKKLKDLSKGYQSIFKCIIALSLHVPYVFFDEPVLGLDANHRDLFYRYLLEEYENEERTFILATHLIEEIAPIIEEVVCIDQGKIILQENVESLLEQSYSVSGPSDMVKNYCQDLRVIGSDDLGGMRIAYILGNRPEYTDDQLQIAPISLQKLFIKLTAKGEEPHA